MKAEEFYKQKSNSIRGLWALSPRQIEYISLIMEEYAALRQPLVSGELHPDIEKLLRYTIKQWSNLNEQREPDHEDLINNWLNGDLKEWIKSNYC